MSDLQRVGEHIRVRVKLPSVDPMVLDARQVWADAVGESVARNALPVRRSGDALVVHCSSSTWAAELAMLERQILGRLATVLDPAPARLRFEVGTVLQESPAEPPPPPLPALTPEQRERAEELVSGIADEALAARVREAIELSLRRGA
jgi:hypothetical protein